MRDAHSSGKFDATADQWAKRLDIHTNVVGVTEALDAEVPATWARPKRRETDVLYRPDGNLIPVKGGTAHIPTPSWRRGSRRMEGVDLRWLLFDHPGVWSLLRLTAHFPAHLYRREQRAAHRSAMEALVPALMALRAHTGADEVTLSADFNMDLRRKRNTHALEHHGFRVVAPRRPTHGLRVIDGFLTTLHGTAEVLPAVKGFDHRAVIATLQRTPEEK